MAAPSPTRTGQRSSRKPQDCQSASGPTYRDARRRIPTRNRGCTVKRVTVRRGPYACVGTNLEPTSCTGWEAGTESNRRHQDFQSSREATNTHPGRFTTHVEWPAGVFVSRRDPACKQSEANLVPSSGFERVGEVDCYVTHAELFSAAHSPLALAPLGSDILSFLPALAAPALHDDLDSGDTGKPVGQVFVELRLRRRDNQQEPDAGINLLAEVFDLVQGSLLQREPHEHRHRTDRDPPRSTRRPAPHERRNEPSPPLLIRSGKTAAFSQSPGVRTSGRGSASRTLSGIWSNGKLLG